MESIHVSMFGGIDIRCGSKILLESGMRLNKPFELLLLLLLHREDNLTNDQLMDQLWESGEVENPVGALKNAAYNLRRQLQKTLPGMDCIVTEGRQYRWNRQIPVQVDVDRFQQMVGRLTDADKGMSVEERCDLQRRALTLYKGDFLPGLNDRQWVMQQANYLRQLYYTTMLNLCDTLLDSKKNTDQEEVIDLCNHAVMLDPLYDALYDRMFAAMRNLEMRKAIIDYYPVLYNLLQGELGTGPSPKVQAIYAWAQEGGNHSLEDIKNIVRDLDETTRDNLPIRGAFFCPYETFKHMYNMVVRTAARNDSTTLLMLLTLVINEGCAVHRDDMNKNMLRLRNVVQASLRKGDVFSRYSSNQYILMLPVKRPEDCCLVEKRLRTAFEGLVPPLKVSLTVITTKPNPIL